MYSYITYQYDIISSKLIVDKAELCHYPVPATPGINRFSLQRSIRNRVLFCYNSFNSGCHTLRSGKGQPIFIAKSLILISEKELYIPF